MIGKQTGAKPRLIDGDTFRCYVTGITQTEWRNNDGRIVVFRNANRTTYAAAVDNVLLRPRFRSLHSAMRAGVKELAAPPQPDGTFADGTTYEIKAGMGTTDIMESLYSPQHYAKGDY